ncbi:hypothetical protein ACQPZZ_14630 [Microbispora sp. CA-135349]|uniref:hypothetical protein n=1 Tax=Microbispora sp. CA-135349 TaxID=3239953 RepID=UPI003D90EF1D
MTWLVMGAVAVVAAVFARRWAGRLKKHPPADRANARDLRTNAVGKVVLDAYGTEWAKQFGRSREEVRDAVLGDAHPDLRERIDREIGVVDVRFDHSGGGAPATVTVAYRHDGAHSTARLRLPWESLPDGVRVELLQTGRSTASRTWRAVPEEQAVT